jgi:hypothetical protein
MPSSFVTRILIINMFRVLSAGMELHCEDGHKTGFPGDVATYAPGTPDKHVFHTKTLN